MTSHDMILSIYLMQFRVNIIKYNFKKKELVILFKNTTGFHLPRPGTHTRVT